LIDGFVNLKLSSSSLWFRNKDRRGRDALQPLDILPAQGAIDLPGHVLRQHGIISLHDNAKSNQDENEKHSARTVDFISIADEGGTRTNLVLNPDPSCLGPVPRSS
jgi:hypothetical protein